MASGYLIASILVLALFEYCSAGGHGGGHKKVIIHVPYKVKTIHHTHTVYKHVGGEKGGDEGGYKVIGYSGDGDVSLGHGEEVHPDVGEHAGGFTVGGDHGYWHHSGGLGGGDDGGHAISLASSGSGHEFAGLGAYSGGGGGHEDLGSFGGSSGHGDLGGVALEGGHGYDLSSGSDSYGNSISGGGDHGGLGGLGSYGGGGDDGGHKGYD